MYNLNDYQVFFYVAECENMRKAALVLGLTPPTVSRIIHDLELELDCQLFTRSKHGVRLTNAGELLYARVKPALGILRTGENELRALTNMDSGRICIGTGVMTAQSFLIPKCLSMYCKKYPHISVYLSGVAGGEMEEALLSGDIDFAVMPSDIVGHKESDIEVRHLYKENSAAVVGKRFAHLSQRELSLEELAQYPLISMPEHYAIYAYYRELYKKLDVRFKPEIEVTAIDMQITAAEVGLGYTFVPEPAAHRAIAEGRLFPLHLTEDILLKTSICLFTPTNFPLTRAAQAFVDIIFQVIGQSNK